MVLVICLPEPTFNGITHGQSCLEAATFANRAASAVVGKYGPRLHSADKCLKLL